MPCTNYEQEILQKYNAMFVEHTDDGHFEMDRSENGQFHRSIDHISLLICHSLDLHSYLILFHKSMITTWL